MALRSLLVLFLAFNKLIIYSDALNCRKGEKVRDDRGKTSCEACPDGSYQPTENSSQKCTGCTKCMEGSYVKVPCTKVSDAICQCREGFVPRFVNSAMCKCQPGSEIKNGVCSKCKEGYFSTENNTPCRKWNDCKATGVKTPGSSTCDVVCNEESSSNPQSSTSIRKTFSLYVTKPRSHEGTETLNSATTTSPPPQKDNENPPSHSSNHTDIILVCLGIAGLLVWAAITYKMHIILCYQKKTMQTSDSLCRRPVEESGESSETSVKLNLEP
ncbi:tumor necrosis factor receptor superfamily member 4 [Nematolebias whitei]|uniref:tumor necrosis factor receptor superfamily member 4 n=1 Tax=Nematolebias whitei TaxID=451745 RepID=UPI0018996F22|nr:tumor necrosis factor receptor superfamily member 4 [Nematolebias whitei]